MAFVCPWDGPNGERRPWPGSPAGGRAFRRRIPIHAFMDIEEDDRWIGDKIVSMEIETEEIVVEDNLTLLAGGIEAFRKLYATKMPLSEESITIAGEFGFTEFLQRAFEAGHDIRSALYSAIQFAEMPTVKWFINNHREKIQSSVPSYAYKVENYEAFWFLIEKGGFQPCETCFYLAAKEGDVECLKRLVAMGFGALLSKGNSAVVHHLSGYGNLEDVKWAIANGALIDEYSFKRANTRDMLNWALKRGYIREYAILPQSVWVERGDGSKYIVNPEPWEREKYTIVRRC